MIEENVDRFHVHGERPTATSVLQHRIPTTDNQPVFTRQYRFLPIHQEELLRRTNDLCKKYETIQHKDHKDNTPVWIVPKKADSQGNKRWRMVLDFLKLNEKTISDSFPLPNIHEILDQLGDAQYFSVFDLASGFHQIKMSPQDSHKMAVSTPCGHYEFDRMPFGLKMLPLVSNAL